MSAEKEVLLGDITGLSCLGIFLFPLSLFSCCLLNVVPVDWIDSILCKGVGPSIPT